MNKLHNKHPNKIPGSQCTIAELASILLNMEAETEINFSQNPDGSDYWGAKKLALFEQEIIIFGYYGGPALQKYELEKDVLSDMVRHLCYHLAKQENEIVYLFETEKQEQPEETKENIVSSFFFHMWNAWCKEECKATFGYEYQHFWIKWRKICEKHSVYGAAEKFYAELSGSYRVKLVARACEIYDGNTRRKDNP